MAREFFTSRGWHCPPRQTTADFLTSLTNPSERIPKEGWQSRVPRTADEFAKQWQESPERKQLLVEIEQYESEYPIGGELLEKFKHSRNAQQANRMCVTIYLIHFCLQLLTHPLTTGTSSLPIRSRFQCRFDFARGVVCDDWLEIWQRSTPLSSEILPWLLSLVRRQMNSGRNVKLKRVFSRVRLLQSGQRYR
jgi:hypothetical protein